jgi:putative ABC transport system permease protein
MVLKSALALVCGGLILGVPVAFWSRRVAARLIANLQVDSASSIGFAVATIVAVALLAAYVPARRAARVQPMDALRHS